MRATQGLACGCMAALMGGHQLQATPSSSFLVSPSDPLHSSPSPGMNHSSSCKGLPSVGEPKPGIRDSPSLWPAQSRGLWEEEGSQGLTGSQRSLHLSLKHLSGNSSKELRILVFLYLFIMLTGENLSFL